MLDVYIDIVAMSLLNRIKTTTLRLLFVCVYVCTACLHDASTRARVTRARVTRVPHCLPA